MNNQINITVDSTDLNIVNAPLTITGNGVVAGSNTQVQYNNAGVFGASANFVYNEVSSNLSVSGNVITNNLVSNTALVGNTITISNGSGGAITGANSVSANFFIGNGSLLTSLTAANVVGVVANANYAAFAGNATVANTAYAIDGANVSGVVANANYAAYAGNATVANTANTANIANIAYSVDAANINGQVANALVAGTVYTNAQPNITSVGNLTSLTVVGTTTIQQAKEKVTPNNVAATGTINFDVLTQAILLNTANASANFTLNIRGNATTTLNNVISNNESLTCTFINRNANTAFYANAFTIDSTAITPLYVGGFPPNAGIANGRDVYNFNIIKTGNATYTVLLTVGSYK